MGRQNGLRTKGIPLLGKTIIFLKAWPHGFLRDKAILRKKSIRAGSTDRKRVDMVKNARISQRRNPENGMPQKKLPVANSRKLTIGLQSGAFARVSPVSLPQSQISGSYTFYASDPFGPFPDKTESKY